VLRTHSSLNKTSHAYFIEKPLLPIMLQAFDPEAEIEVRRRNLPHWRQAGATYIVTFRLGDSLPQAKLEELRAERLQWLKRYPPPRSEETLVAYQCFRSNKIEEYLAAGYGACWLKQAILADQVANALLFFDGQRYALGDFVVMPNHVHALVRPLEGFELSDILHSWKSFTANQINRIVGRKGKLWQDESFDHIVRDEHYLLAYQHYIADNPRMANLREGEYRMRACGPDFWRGRKGP
jgi:REP element-mobilizing transposase RayT